MDLGDEKFPIIVIVIAQNEEANIAACLKSVVGWAQEVYVVDAYSTDATPKLAAALGAKVVQHEFINWAEQRNWAIENLPIKTDWVLFLDADEQIGDSLKNEIRRIIIKQSDAFAYSVRQAFIFLGKYLKHAHDAPLLIRLVRRGKAKWICEGAREYCIVDGKVKNLKNRLWHEDAKGLSAWIDKQNRNATREAEQILRGFHYKTHSLEIKKYVERPFRTWFRRHLYPRIPGFLRPFLHFSYRYFLRGGFLDGYPGFVFCFLHAFWYPLLIDAKVKEMQMRDMQNSERELYPTLNDGTRQGE